MPSAFTLDHGQRIVSVSRADLADEPTPAAYRSDAYDLIARAYAAARQSGMTYEEARRLWSFPFFAHFGDLEDSDA